MPSPSVTAARGPAVVRATGIRITYGDRLVLDGLSLAASPGYRLGPIGENRAGMSTLLRILPDERARHHRRGRGRPDPRAVPRPVPPRPVLRVPAPTAHRICTGRPRIRRDVRHCRPRSAAPRALAAPLLVRPDALLLDEPTNHLDDEAVAFRASRLRAWGRLIVVASRDRRLRRRWTGTALALVGGRVAQEVAV